MKIKMCKWTKTMNNGAVKKITLRENKSTTYTDTDALCLDELGGPLNTWVAVRKLADGQEERDPATGAFRPFRETGDFIPSSRVVGSSSPHLAMTRVLIT